MRSKVRHGGALRCDMVHVRETTAEVLFEKQCPRTFVTYSMASLTRAQAAHAGWVRVKAGLVKWTGEPAAGPQQKVDLCPDHAGMVLTESERKAAKEKERADKKAAKAKVANEAKAAKKVTPEKPRKKKPQAEAAQC